MDDVYDDVYDPDYDPDDVTCKFCGEEELEWVHTGKRWALFGADGILHVCSRTASADDFEDLAKAKWRGE